MRKLGIVITVIFLFGSLLFATPIENSSTIAGVNGYIVIPSALPSESSSNRTAITTGYSAIFDIPSGFAHVPFIQVAFKKNFEASVAVDIYDDADLIVNGKWRFIEKKGTSFALGLNAQLLKMRDDLYFGGKLYFASTFNSTFISLPSKTTVLLGYSIDEKKTTYSDIDFGMGFQAPFFPKVFKNKVDFLIDFGNVSYSNRPSGGNADNRGMFNLGLRLLPIQIMKGTFVGVDLSMVDLFDDSGRAISLGASLTFMP